MNVYPVKLQRNGKSLTVTLKLDLNHIRELCEKYSKDILEIVTEAATSPSVLGDILDAALRHRHNDNPVDLDGDELFDLLVEAGKMSGMTAWMELSNNVSVVSGILDKEQAAAMLKSVRRRMDAMVDSLNADSEVDVDPSALKESEQKDALPHS